MRKWIVWSIGKRSQLRMETVTNALPNPPNRQSSNMPQFEREFLQNPWESCTFCKNFRQFLNDICVTCKKHNNFKTHNKLSLKAAYLAHQTNSPIESLKSHSYI